jgi:hypothetical protein
VKTVSSQFQEDSAGRAGTYSELRGFLLKFFQKRATVIL